MALAGTLHAGCGLGGVRPSPLTGDLGGHREAALGHRVREPSPVPTGTVPPAWRQADVVIVGAGVAGLSAAWRLTRAGYTGRVLLLDLADPIGGTAFSGVADVGPYPWGAHYITLPGPEAIHVRAMLADFGVITGFDAEGRPAYDPLALCLAPEERLHELGHWIEGLWPTTLATAEDRRSHEAFLADVARWTTTRGADGRYAFAIPVAASSMDPAIRALARVSFGDWLRRQGYGGDVFRWWTEYACRDDYGMTLSETSAWAGLHYFASRRPDPAHARDLGTDVLTWPAGNGFLVDALARRSRATVVTGAVVLAVDADSGRVVCARGETVWELAAARIILAVPNRVASHLVRRVSPSDAPDAAPWRVAQLHVTRRPAARGVQTAWDSVIYGARSLGYVTSTHQDGAYRGPAVLTWYEALADVPPADGRLALLATDWTSEAERVIEDMAPSHGDLQECLTRLDIWHWGHGTVRPSLGLHDNDTLARLAAPMGRVAFAHTDLSGLSLFEEASWHGVHAAEETLAALGQSDNVSLTTAAPP